MGHHQLQGLLRGQETYLDTMSVQKKKKMDNISKKKEISEYCICK